MTIYTADALDFKPVDKKSKDSATGTKKTKKSKEPVQELEKEKEPDRKTYAIKQLPTIPKKEPTAAQLAGRAKAAETRRLKKEALTKEGNISAAELKHKKKINAKLPEDEGAIGETDPSKGEIVLGTSSRPAKRKNNEGGIRMPRKRTKKSDDNDTLVQSPSPLTKHLKEHKCRVEPLKPIEEVSSSEEEEKRKTPVKKPRKQTAPKRYIKSTPEIKFSDKQPAFLEKMAEEYVQNQVRLSGLAKSKKEVKDEARKIATSVWDDPVAKQNIQQRNAAHLKKMYVSIFPNSKRIPNL